MLHPPKVLWELVKDAANHGSAGQPLGGDAWLGQGFTLLPGPANAHLDALFDEIALCCFGVSTVTNSPGFNVQKNPSCFVRL